jgi:hypothetical protein
MAREGGGHSRLLICTAGQAGSGARQIRRPSRGAGSTVASEAITRPSRCASQPWHPKNHTAEPRSRLNRGARLPICTAGQAGSGTRQIRRPSRRAGSTVASDAITRPSRCASQPWHPKNHTAEPPSRLNRATSHRDRTYGRNARRQPCALSRVTSAVRVCPCALRCSCSPIGCRRIS